MRCCLILFRSAVMSSSRLIVLCSMTLATISRYGRMRELTNVASSSTTSSNDNVAFSDGTAGSRISREPDSRAGPTPEHFILTTSEEIGASWQGRVRDAGMTHNAAWLDLLRLPLSRFFFLRPDVVP